ncbi:hypothetical protein [Microbacterium sp. BR1]|uniref:hypothetical protein n=1 Tax=Microbacterium sp. BR1 TaxID=1070896 RepID=UPI000C2C07E4|nr:hypothetical protein [Microbacterium sp. BR1]
MRRTIKRALLGALIGGGLAFAGATVAQAAETSGDDGTASGTQALVNVTLPVTLGGNGVSVLGDSSSTGATTPAPAPAPVEPAVTTGGTDGLASGTQGVVSVDVPVTVGGNAISVLGDSQSTDSAGTDASAPAPAPAEPAQPASAPTTSGDDAVLGGTQAVAPIQAPVTVGGNAISVLGDSQSTGASTAPGTAGTGTGTDATTNGDDAVLGGTQAVAPVQAPVTAGGNAISVLGDSQSTGASTAPGTAGTGTGTDATTNGDDGIAGRTQVQAPIQAPVTAGGNAISVLGDSQSTGAMVAAPTTGGTGEPVTTGTEGVLGGTQLVAPIALPLTLGGNAVSVVGDSTTTGPTGPVVPTDPTDPTDPGNPGTDGPGDGTPGTGGVATGVTGDVGAGVGVAPAALSVTALALTGSTPASLWFALLALIAGIALVGTAALRRRTARD